MGGKGAGRKGRRKWRAGGQANRAGNKKASPLREKLLGRRGRRRLWYSSDFADVHGVDALAAFLRFEFHPVILLHCGPIQARYVNEKILLGLVVGYKAIAFGFVEKFNDTGFHAKN
jgi:hypothetical protein